MNMKDYREQIDRIDEQMVQLFIKRMEVASKIAIFKQQNNIPITDIARENEKLNIIQNMVKEPYKPYVSELYEKIFQLSKEMQEECQKKGDNV